ncbi:MAG: TolC family protein, partial [Planctomycetota bacterium]
LRTLGLLEDHLAAGSIDLVQVDQFRQNIETERANLLQSQNALKDALDQYKTGTLGLPPHLKIALDDQLIRQFQFIDPTMSDVQNRIALFRQTFGELPEAPGAATLKQVLNQVIALYDTAGRQIKSVEQDLIRMEAAVRIRTPNMTAEQVELLENDVKRLREDLAELRKRLEGTQTPLGQLADKIASGDTAESVTETVELVTTLASVVDELSLVQARARLEAVAVQPERLRPDEALAIARANRLDWMNNRAALVDTWRLIAFNADDLQSDLDIVLDGDLRTEGNNAMKFRAPTGTFRASLQFDAPFTRLLERNNFRQQLIDYQQDRRQLIRFEDGIHQTLRALLRQLKELETNLEIQRRAVAIAIRRVDKTRQDLDEPPPPVQPGQLPEQFSPTTAINLLTALSDLRSAQNAFMSVWLNFYAARMQLMRELGIMEIDNEGKWVDTPLWEAMPSRADDIGLPPPLPGEWLEAIEPELLPSPEPAVPRADARAGAHVVEVGLHAEKGGEKEQGPPPRPPDMSAIRAWWRERVVTVPDQKASRGNVAKYPPEWGGFPKLRVSKGG